MSRPLLLAVVAVAAGCGTFAPPVSEAVIPSSQGPGGGGLFVLGSINGGATFPLLIDTGTALTAHHAPDHPRVEVENLRLLDAAGVARVEFQQIQVLETPLGPVGIDGRDLAVGGVLGGDLLQLYRVKLHYGAAPTLSLLPAEIGCSCALADSCQAVLPFTLAGGGTFAPDESGNIYNYRATRVTLDVCLAPVVDPQARGVCCEDGQDLALGYTRDGAPGVDVRLLVATGFPGVLLGASAYDRLYQRLCGRLATTPWQTTLCQGGPSQTLLATSSLEIRFLNPAATIHRAARVTLGDPAALFGTPGNRRSQPLAAMAVVARERLLSPCVELSRSRRLRAHPPSVTDCNGPGRPPPEAGRTCLQVLSSTGNELCDNPDRCNDRDQPAAAYLELDDPLPVYVVDDTAAVLQEVNFDVRPTLSAVEGVVGSELLARLEAEIDYPNRRIIAHCGSMSGCTAYPRFACPASAGDCGERNQDPFDLCNPPAAIVPGGPICLPSPVEQRRHADGGSDAAPHCDAGGD